MQFVGRLLLGLAMLTMANGLSASAQEQVSERNLQRWLNRYPQADANGDGKLSAQEARNFRDKQQRPRNAGVAREFAVDPGWEKDAFPEHAVCYMSPVEIKALYESQLPKGKRAVISFPEPEDGSLRIVGTGHSFMAPGYKTLPIICRAAGMEQKLYTHTGGGMTGSTRYKWEQENGIFGFDRRPTPKLLASISNAKWDAMMWGPYFNDRPEYYSCWIDFCLKYNPDMKFYLSDAWPQLFQLEEKPKSEAYFTSEVIERMGQERRAYYQERVDQLLKDYPNRIYVMPTSDAMVLAAQAYLEGNLPGIEGFHKAIGRKERSLWRDELGHLGPGFEWLEGYVFYATLYKRSPELIEGDIVKSNNGFPSRELDRTFRKIAWEAVTNYELTGVTDQDGDGIGDEL